MRVAAGAVVAPLRLAAAATCSTTAISMSVAVKLSAPSFTRSSALARIGIVLRFSATGLSGGSGEIVPGLLLVAYALCLLTMPFWLTAFFGVMSRP